jgi:hypothetical protein
LVIFSFHLACKPARGHGLDRRRGDILADSDVVEPALEAGAYVRISLP